MVFGAASDLMIKIGGDASGFKRAITDVKSSARGMTDQISSSLKGLDNKKIRTNLDTSGVKSGVHHVKSELGTIPSKKTVEIDVKADTGVLGGLKSKLGGLGGILSGAAGGAAFAGVGMAASAMTGLVGGAVDYLSSIEQSNIAFGVMLKDQGKANTLMGSLKSLAAATPFEFPELAASAKRMLAFGFEAEKIPGLLTTIGNTASAFGVGAEGIDTISTSLGRMSKSGKVSLEDINMLTDIGVPALDYLAAAFYHGGDASKVTQSDIKKLYDEISKGSLDSGKAVTALTTGMDRDFGGMMERQSKTFSGLMSTLADTINETLGTALKPAFEWIVSTGLPMLTTIISGLKTVIEPVISFVGGLFTAIRDNMGMVLPVIAGIIAALIPVAAALGAFAPIGTAIAVVVAAITAAISGIGASISGLISTFLFFGGLAAVLNPVTIAIMAIAAGFTLLYTTSSTFRDVIGGLISKIQELTGWFVKLGGVLLSGDFGKAGAMIKTAFIDAFNSLKNFDWGSIPKIITNIFQESASSIRGFFGGIVNSVRGFAGSVGGALNTIKTADYGGIFRQIGTNARTAGGQIITALGPNVSAAIAATGNVSKTLQSTLRSLGPEATHFATALGGAFGWLMKGDIQGAITILLHAFTHLFGTLRSMDWGTIGRKIIDEIIASVKAKAGEILSTIKGALSGAGAAISGAVGSAGASLGGAGAALGGMIGPLGAQLSTALTSAFNTLKSVDWGAMFSQAREALVNAFQTAIARLKSVNWGPILLGIAAALLPLPTLIYTLITRVDWGALGGQIMGALQGAAATISDAFGRVGETLGGAFDAIKSVDWGGLFAGALDAMANVLDTIMNADWAGMTDTAINAIVVALGTIPALLSTVDWGGFADGLVEGINTAFSMLLNYDWGGLVDGFVAALTSGISSLFGGEGEATAAAGDGMADGLSKGVETAGPNILGKLGDVFKKLLLVVPTVFYKIGVVLLEHLSRVDWGRVAMLVVGAIGLGFAKLGALLAAIDWGLIAAKLGDALTFVAKRLWDFLMTLDYGSIAARLWGALQGALGTLGSWLWGLISPIPGQLWGALVGSIAGFGLWLWGLISPIPGQLWGGITGALGSFGSWLWGMISHIPGQLGSAIQSAVSGFGSWLASGIGNLGNDIGNAVRSGVDSAIGAFTGLGQAVVDGFRNAWNSLPSVNLPGIGSFPPKVAGGGIFGPKPGGRLAIVAEAGEPEAWIPQHLWGHVDPRLLNSLPRYGAGAIVSGGGAQVVRAGTAYGGPSAVYNNYIAVDSENIRREVVRANQDLERYHHMRA